MCLIAAPLHQPPKPYYTYFNHKLYGEVKSNTAQLEHTSYDRAAASRHQQIRAVKPSFFDCDNFTSARRRVAVSSFQQTPPEENHD